MRVSPFRNPRLNGYVRLPAAYRSLSRLSSALSAKASALRPFRLTTLCLPLSRPAILAYMAAVQILILLFGFLAETLRCLPIFCNAFLTLPDTTYCLAALSSIR